MQAGFDKRSPIQRDNHNTPTPEPAFRAATTKNQQLRRQWQPLGFFLEKVHLPPNKLWYGTNDDAENLLAAYLKGTQHFIRITYKGCVRCLTRDTIMNGPQATSRSPIRHIYTIKVEKIINRQVLTTNFVSVSFICTVSSNTFRGQGQLDNTSSPTLCSRHFKLLRRIRYVATGHTAVGNRMVYHNKFVVAAVVL